MTDRELLIEIVETMRLVAAALKQLSESPMMSALGIKI